MSGRIERWKAAWESCDLDRIVALYSDDAEHSSRLVTDLFAELGRSTLRGKAEIREYVSRGLLWFVTVRIDVVSAMESGDRSAVEYRRSSNLDSTPAHVLELIDWSGDLIRSSTIFQF